MNIIIAEDNVDHSELLEIELLKYFPSCELLFAQTGEELIQFLRASAELPDLILMDIKMPRMNGPETLRHIKRVEQWRSIPIIVNSTSASTHDVNACFELGASHYLTKPLQADALLRCLKSLDLL